MVRLQARSAVIEAGASNLLRNVVKRSAASREHEAELGDNLDNAIVFRATKFPQSMGQPLVWGGALIAKVEVV